jgi:hypothetical protein
VFGSVLVSNGESITERQFRRGGANGDHRRDQRLSLSLRRGIGGKAEFGGRVGRGASVVTHKTPDVVAVVHPAEAPEPSRTSKFCVSVVASPHWSFNVQMFPSLQEFVLGVLTQPVEGLHVSVVQSLPSLQFRGVPTQMPSWQVSAVVQAVPSLHAGPVPGIGV